MFTRAIAVCLSLGAASSALGAIRVELTKIPDQVSYTNNQVVTVEVRLRQDPAAPAAHLLRYVHFDLNNSRSVPEGLNFNVTAPVTHNKSTPTLADDIRFWNFNTVTGCPTPGSSDCGRGHIVDSDLAGSRPKLISIAYFGDLATQNLQDAANLQLNLPASTSVFVGTVNVTMPATGNGTYTLDLINAAQTDPDAGGEVRYGFGVAGGTPSTDPITSFRANGGGMVGGTTTFCVGPQCGGGECTVHMVLAQNVFTCDSSLPRVQSNTVRLKFDGPITLPTAAQIEIGTISDGGVFGPNLAGSFTFSVEPGNVLKVLENGNVLANSTWYGIRNTGAWPEVCDFKVTYPKVMGDADNNLATGFSDLIFINNRQTATADDVNRSDIDSNGGVGFSDIIAANARNGSAAPTPKPTGHDCFAETGP